MTEKKSAATISAAEQQLEGCPLPASVVARTLSIRSCVALFCNAASKSSETVELAIGAPFGIRMLRMLPDSSQSSLYLSAITWWGLRLTKRKGGVNQPHHSCQSSLDILTSHQCRHVRVTLSWSPLR